MRLTGEVLRAAPAYVNAIRQREINLRNYKIPLIENLGVTENLYEVIDLSDNEILKIENLPLLERLVTLLFNNNRICKIGKGLAQSVPNLTTLILTNNKITSFQEIDLISQFSSLTCLSLLGNPVSRVEHYRLYTIFRMPHLKILDFNKVKPKERRAAKILFKSTPAIDWDNVGDSKQDSSSSSNNNQDGMDVDDDKQQSAGTFTPGETLANRLTPEKRALILEKLQKATSLEEVSKLETMLTTGDTTGLEE